MAIDTAGIARIDAFLATLGGEITPQVADLALRRLLPGIEMRHCDASDVLEDAFRETAEIDLHLLDTAGHCIRVTTDPAEATAILIAGKVRS